MKWLPKKRIATIERKLNGEKPSRIMLDELANMHDDGEEDMESEYFTKYKLIVNGEDHQQVRIRSTLKNEGLTAKEQVCYYWRFFLFTLEFFFINSDLFYRCSVC